MPKGWAAQARSVRWLAAGIAAVVLAPALTWVLFVPAADWLADHDVGSVKGSLHETALDNARGRLLTLGAGLFAAGALVFTARNYTLSRRTVELTRRTFELTEQGQVTDRYTKAIEQLGSDKPDVRIGGIYALERVARDSATDHPTVMEVLTAFTREYSREQEPPSGPSRQQQERSTRLDVQAAVTVVGRRDPERDIRGRPIDLTGAVLPWAVLPGAVLSGARLTGADLSHAILFEADLTGAMLDRAHLTGANLNMAHLTGAHLNMADLTKADLFGADLTHADLRGAHLPDATLTGATLTGATLTGADLNMADLNRATLTDVDLTKADLTGAWWPVGTPVPEGWKLHSLDWRRLERAGTDSGPTEAS